MNDFLSTKLLSSKASLLYTMGFGVINFVFAIPAFLTIDTLGRRSLLLFTFPFLALFQIFNAIAFKTAASNWRLAVAGTYLFTIFYSPGEGPVPFVYAAESMPLYMRDFGMGLVTSFNWLFNWLIAFTAPQYFSSFNQYGIFIWYAAWCIVLWFMIF